MQLFLLIFCKQIIVKNTFRYFVYVYVQKVFVSLCTLFARVSFFWYHFEYASVDYFLIFVVSCKMCDVYFEEDVY